MTTPTIIEIISKTKEIVEEAIKLDKGGHKKLAIKLYLQVAESLIEATKFADDHNPQLSVVLHQKVMEYLQRAHKLNEEEMIAINDKTLKVNTDQFTELDYERVLAKYPTLLTGILNEDYRILGRQVKTSDGKRLDILIQDPEGKLAVIEIKTRKALTKDIDQVMNYIQSIQNYGQVDLGNHYILVREVYGILVAPEFDSNVLLYALKHNVILKQLDVKLLETILLANAFRMNRQ